MSEENPPTREVDQFILEQIDTVPHLEALLLSWNKRPKAWSVDEMAGALYVPTDLAETIMGDLVQRGLLQQSAASPVVFRYASSSAEQDDLIARVDLAYRHELIRITRMIHAKKPSALQEFARAFRFTKEKD